MRLIKELPNEFCKASLYGFNNKFIIRFEAGNLEQIFKVSEFDVAGADEVEEMLGDTFMHNVMNRFKTMQEDLDEVLDSID